ncbi:MAG: DUF1499 domain-containing protein [Sulfitobacter sp. SK025]|nr:MAG: DUF1499 domain-containing protein [Sulfitobacter sp. SK025]
MWILIGVLALIGAVQVYVRFAPTQADRWVIVPNEKTVGDYRYDNGFMVVRDVDGSRDSVLKLFDQEMLKVPRTRRIATISGQNIYESRSKLWGFPDYTTVSVAPLPGMEQSRAVIFSRLRFGKSDMGVNRKRMNHILRRLGLEL